MREINPDSVSKSNQPVLVLRNGGRQQQLITVNRYLVYLVMALMTLVVALGTFLWPTENPLNTLHVPVTHLQQPNSALSTEISLLKGQMAGLVSGSIESKLRILEDSIRSGSVNNALGTIQDIKRDVRVLQTYSEPAISKMAPKQANDILLKEVSHLKNLVYLTLASVSLMFAAFAGVWFNKRYRLTHQRTTYLQKEKNNGR